MADKTAELRAILHCPAGPELARRATRLATECYAGDAMPPERFEQLRAKNPNVLACLTNARGEFLGYFDVLPLRPDFAGMLLAGRATARQSGKATGRAISQDDVFSSDEMDKCTNLYVAGIAVCRPDTYSGRRQASMLVWGFWKYLEHFYPHVRPRQVFAVAATQRGENLLRRFGFLLYGEARDRRDKHPLYMLVLSPDALRRAVESLPDWSALCGLTWARG